MTMGFMTSREVCGARCGVRSAKGSPSALDDAVPSIFSGLGSGGHTYGRVVERLVRAGVESALLDAACLMEAASGIPRWRFISEPERPVPHGASDLLDSMLSRREAREPVAYILGVKEFWSLSLSVCPEVLIPRPETETLVEAVLDKISSQFRVHSSEFTDPASRSAPQSVNSELTTQNSRLRIVDLGTGCGAIALALAVEIPHARIHALDRSAVALRIARQNAEALGLIGRVHCLQGDLFEPLRTIQGWRGFDLIVSNPPYIPSGALAALPPEVAAYEPREALDGGSDGLDYHRRIIEDAPGYLSEEGWLALEVGDGQAPAVMGLFRRTEAFGPAEVKRDLAGRDRVVVAPRRARTDG